MPEQRRSQWIQETRFAMRKTLGGRMWSSPRKAIGLAGQGAPTRPGHEQRTLVLVRRNGVRAVRMLTAVNSLNWPPAPAAAGSGPARDCPPEGEAQRERFLGGRNPGLKGRDRVDSCQLRSAGPGARWVDQRRSTALTLYEETALPGPGRCNTGRRQASSGRGWVCAFRPFPAADARSGGGAAAVHAAVSTSDPRDGARRGMRRREPRAERCAKARRFRPTSTGICRRSRCRRWRLLARRMGRPATRGR